VARGDLLLLRDDATHAAAMACADMAQILVAGQNNLRGVRSVYGSLPPSKLVMGMWGVCGGYVMGM
jgi:hypothetical protein